MSNAVTPVFRVSYPNLFTARKNDLNGKDEFSVVALFKKGEDLSSLKKLAEAACIKKWGADKSAWPKNIRTPFRDQGERAKDGKMPSGYEEGAIFINFKSTVRPGLVDQQVQEVLESSKFYSGCFAKASVNAFAYDQKGNRGVSFGLSHVQFVADGETLSGRPKVQDAFAPISEDAESAASLF